MNLVRCYLQIAMLLRGPQALPASRTLLGISLAAYIIMGVVLALVVSTTMMEALQLSVVDTLLLAGVVYGSLSLRKLDNRRLQTLSAAAGVGALISLVGALVLGLQFPGELYLLIVLWYVAVLAHIFRHALSVPLPLGLGVALLYLFLSLTLSGLILPPEAASS